MSGPIRTLSMIIEDVTRRTNEARSLTRRMRDANRHLTGGDGQAPTPLNPSALGRGETDTKQEVPALMIQVTLAVDALEIAMAELRGEMDYLEQFSETWTDQTTEAAPVKSYR